MSENNYQERINKNKRKIVLNYLDTKYRLAEIQILSDSEDDKMERILLLKKIQLKHTDNIDEKLEKIYESLCD